MLMLARATIWELPGVNFPRAGTFLLQISRLRACGRLFCSEITGGGAAARNIVSKLLLSGFNSVWQE